MRHSPILAAAVLALSASGAAHAATSVYTDEALWRAAVGTFAFEDFDGFATGAEINSLALGLQFDPLDDGTQPTVQPYSFTGGSTRSGPNNLLNDRDNTLPGRGPIGVRPIDPTDFIFGLGLWNVGGDDKLRLTFYDAFDAVIASVESASGIGFFGIVDDTGASRAVVDFVAGNGYAPTDDWQTAARPTFEPPEAAIPVPAALPLAMTALAGLGLLRARRSQS